MNRFLCATLLALLAAPLARAQQHEGMHHPMPDSTHADGMPMDHPMPGMDHPMPGHAPMANSLFSDLPMNRDGSGTGWLPDASPMEAVHAAAGAWNVMLHGTLFLRYTAQDAFDSGSRGNSTFDAPNWAMGMAQRRIGRGGQLSARAMLSLDPLTEGGNGYPLLFQTGETFDDAPLIDRQHPHDLVSELSVSYGQTLGERAGVFAYLGYPGEPALGPVAFMHRPSARHNPDAPLGHHWQDASHILFGVATVGIRYDLFKLDGSVFTGREPGENRYDFDRPRFDSYSLRLSANPVPELALQVSRGFLTSPEALEPDVDQWRTTASVAYARPLHNGHWSNTLLWGMNEPQSNGDADPGHGGGAQHSVLLESDLMLSRYAIFTRAEWVQKPAGELGLAAFEDRAFGIGALTVGGARDLYAVGSLKAMLGAQATLYRVPADLRDIYGAQPLSLEVFLRLSPALMRMGGHGM